MDFHGDLRDAKGFGDLFIRRRAGEREQEDLSQFHLLEDRLFALAHLPLKESAERVARVPAGITGDVAPLRGIRVYLDDAVGRIVPAPNRHETTLVIFTSDNGGLGTSTHFIA